MGCQREIAARIVAGEADYALALKDNHPTLHEAVAFHFARAREAGFAGAAHSAHQTVEKGHGRIEVRRCWATDDAAVLAWLDPEQAWAGLRSVAAVEAERRRDGKVTTETRYYLSGLPADAEALLAAVRAHWGIENELHWVLDVAFREDECRVRVGHAAENLAVLRHLAPTLLRREPTAKVGVKAKRLKAAWDDAYRLKVLAS